MKKENSIYIIGTGAIGKVLAAFLQHEGRNVILLRGSVDDKSSHVERIKVELTDNTTVEAEVEINTIGNFAELDGTIVLANKSFGNSSLASTLKSKINNSPIVLLQNGLNIERPFIDNGFSQVYRCVLFISSQTVSQNVLRFKPAAISPIGIINGNAKELDQIVQQLTSSYFQFKSEENIEPVVWTKAIANCVFNSVCPLIGTDNGIFHRDAAALNIAKRIIAECIAVAARKGIFLHADDVINRLLIISKSSDGQLISTYQDINNKRRTEIETLNFAVANIASELGLGDAIQETRLLGELVKLKSELTMATA